ncbi:PIG-L deacetylase family protein [Brachybacterium sp. DNPG3]
MSPDGAPDARPADVDTGIDRDAHGPAIGPWELLEGARTVLAVHAHPDDETLATGALLRALASAGTRVLLVTASRGEEGEIVPGTIDPADPRPLDEVRGAEIDRAARALGIAERFMLGTAPALAPGRAERRYRDSGMRWIREGLAGPSASAGADSFTLRPLDDAVDDLVALIEHLRPDAVIGYDDEGTYGHPDHVRAHQVTAAACTRTGTARIEVASAEDPDGAARPGHVDARGFAWRDLPAAGEAVREALGAYRTQLTVLAPQAEVLPPEGAIAIRHVGGQDDLVALRSGLRRAG